MHSRNRIGPDGAKVREVAVARVCARHLNKFLKVLRVEQRLLCARWLTTGDEKLLLQIRFANRSLEQHKWIHKFH